MRGRLFPFVVTLLYIMWANGFGGASKRASTAATCGLLATGGTILYLHRRCQQRKDYEGKADVVREELNRAQGSVLKLEAMVADGQSRTGEAEKLLAVARENLALAESRASESLTLKEREFETRIDRATSDALKQKAEFHEELAIANGRAEEAEARLGRRLADLERLMEAYERAQDALSAKSQEADALREELNHAQGSALNLEAMVAYGQSRTSEAEKLLAMAREKLTQAESRASESLALKEMEWEARIDTATSDALKQTADFRQQLAIANGRAKETEARLERRLADLERVKEAHERAENALSAKSQELTVASAEASRYRAELVQANMEAKQATTALEGERQSRLCAEMREEDERRERISTMANAQAQATEHRQEMEAQRNARSKMEVEFEHRLKGELDVFRHRLETLSREKESVAVGASVRIEELEAKVQEGEIQRRNMHNIIQELRGNVRVIARVRPFLPFDNVPDEAKPAVVGKGDGVGCMISKRVIGDTNKDFRIDTQSFAFDNAGQEEIFAEVSEFVQSALDGFNVCLFSYGQTGAGKTHTMHGSGAGTMRGIIPRAMEQVGKYKSQLETQGWEYEMQVSFLEIYNEQIRDLLRHESCIKDTKHEIKRDPRGNTTVTDLTMEMVDPNDSAGVDDIMERAACHRSVGRTDMTEMSSRSHSVFTLHLKAMNRQQRSTVKGTLHLVDLAGSERLNRSNATGDRFKETVAINKSLSSLTDVFVAISNKSSHIPFRNSKLTYLLQPALSGDGKTLMMVNLSPTEESYHESLCSLRFAAQVNQCELGRPKRYLRDMGSPDGALTSSKGSTSSRKSSSRT